MKETGIFELRKHVENNSEVPLKLAKQLMKEIDYYRNRLEIDRYYVLDKDLGGMREVISEDNCGADKILCLQVEIDHMKEVITKMHKFIEEYHSDNENIMCLFRAIDLS